jgi:hypothetical protein
MRMNDYILVPVFIDTIVRPAVEERLREDAVET